MLRAASDHVNRCQTNRHELLQKVHCEVSQTGIEPVRHRWQGMVGGTLSNAADNPQRLPFRHRGKRNYTGPASPLPTPRDPGPDGQMPRFGTKELLASTFLIAVGLGGLVLLLKGPPLLDHPIIMFSPWIISGAFIGAGILHPFRLTWAGGFIGATATLCWIMLAIALA